MVDGLFCATLTGCRGGHTSFVQAGGETSDTVAEAIEPDPGSSQEGHSGPVSGMSTTKARVCCAQSLASSKHSFRTSRRYSVETVRTRVTVPSPSGKVSSTMAFGHAPRFEFIANEHEVTNLEVALRLQPLLSTLQKRQVFFHPSSPE